MLVLCAWPLLKGFNPRVMSKVYEEDPEKLGLKSGEISFL